MAEWKLIDQGEIASAATGCSSCPMAYQNTACKLYKKSIYSFVRHGDRPKWCAVISFHVRMAVVDQAVLGGQRPG